MFAYPDNTTSTTATRFIWSYPVFSTDVIWSNTNVGPYGSNHVEVPEKPTKAELARQAMRAHLSSVRPGELRASVPNYHSGPVSPDFSWMTHRFSCYRRKNPSRVRKALSK